MLFRHPTFLWALTLVVVPIIIHFLNLQRTKKVLFSNVALLREVDTNQRSRRKMRDILVLAARILAVVMTVLALSQPFFTSQSSGRVGGTTAVSIFIDNSYSMESAGNEGALIDQARIVAQGLVAAHADDDRFQLLTADMRPEQFMWLTCDEALSAINEVETSPATTMLSEVLSRQSSFVGNAHATNREIYVISDFQQSTSDIENIVDGIETFFIPLSATERANVYIDTLMLDAPSYFTGGTVTATIRVRNDADSPLEDLPIRLYVNGKERAVTTVSLLQDGRADVKMSFLLDSEGWADGWVEIDDNSVKFDNKYFFSIPVTENISMLSIANRATNDAIDRLFRADSTVAYRVASPMQVPADLSLFDFIVVNADVSLAEGNMLNLTNWVHQGGTLLLLPTEADGVFDLSAWPASLSLPTGGQWRTQSLAATSVDYSHRLFANVFTSHSADEERPTVQGYFPLAPPDGHTIVVARLGNDSPLITATRAERGWVYVVATPLEPTLTDFPSQALFVPTFFNMALYSRRQPTPSHLISSLSPIELPFVVDDKAVLLPLGGADSNAITPDVRRLSGRQTLCLHGELSEAGIYLIGNNHLAFNFDRRESQLKFLTVDHLLQHVSTLPHCHVLGNGRNVDVVRQVEERNGKALWSYFVLLALLALAVEQALLWSTDKRMAKGK
ncbi:MAG: BatA domain-containing protein [Bacteroidales bacterium]|nr:BatA domain-containing protein [Bacteroidales bacterium]